LRQENLTKYEPVRMLLTHAKARYYTGETGENNPDQSVLPKIIFKDTVQGDAIDAVRSLSALLKYPVCPLSDAYLNANLIQV